MNTTLTDTTARDRRICATYNSYRSKPFQHRRHRGHKSDALMHTARTWQMPIRDIRAIIETAEAEKRGVDPKAYMAEKAAERNAKTTEWQKQRDAAESRRKAMGLQEGADPDVMERFLHFLTR